MQSKLCIFTTGNTSQKIRKSHRFSKNPSHLHRKVCSLTSSLNRDTSSCWDFHERVKIFYFSNHPIELYLSIYSFTSLFLLCSQVISNASRGNLHIHEWYFRMNALRLMVFVAIVSILLIQVQVCYHTILVPEFSPAFFWWPLTLIGSRNEKKNCYASYWQEQCYFVLRSLRFLTGFSKLGGVTQIAATVGA